MFNFGKRFRRRVFVDDKHGAMTVKIERHNDRTLNILGLTAFTVVFLFFCNIFARPLLRRISLTDFLYVLPFMLFILVWFVIGLRLSLWRAFGVENIVIEGGVLHWTRTALVWKRSLDIPTREITEVRAITPWHGMSNRVEFVANRKKRVIGDMLLRDETTELAHKLSRSLGLTG
jgi:hypothetical protein